MEVLKSELSDPSVIALMVTNVIVAWSLVASHFGTERLARGLTFFAIFPLIVLLSWVGYWKIISDSYVQEKQQTIISELDERAKVISKSLENTSARIKEIGDATSDLKDKLGELEKGIADTLASVKAGNIQVGEQVKTMDDHAREAEACRQFQERQMRDYESMKSQFPPGAYVGPFDPMPCPRPGSGVKLHSTH
jgi:hypothetical protein